MADPNRQPREFRVYNCYDCNWIGNRPEAVEDYQEGWEKPWTAVFCPECGEHAGSEFVVREVLTDERTSG